MKTAMMTLAVAATVLFAGQAFAGAKSDTSLTNVRLGATPASPATAGPILLAGDCYRSGYGYAPSYHRGPSYYRGAYGSPYHGHHRYDAYRYRGHGYPYGYSRSGIGYSGRNFSFYYGF